MYAKTICPNCGESCYHKFRVRAIDTRTGPILKMVETTETISEDELVRNILKSTCISDGIETYELYETIKTCFGISPQVICEIIERVKIELDMYCPDGKHLYFVSV